MWGMLERLPVHDHNLWRKDAALKMGLELSAVARFGKWIYPHVLDELMR